ncbi:MAG: FKBP-type peptidyl-prolyl cis-trans isomerase [Myxococcota bacterium]
MNRTLIALGLVACSSSPPEAVENVEVPTENASAMSASAMAGGASPSLDAPSDVAAPPADAERTASGLASKVLTAATGTDGPSSARDRVTVHYTGWTTDGERFDSSRERGQPATFPLNGVIAGWTEGLQLMKLGEHRRFWIPENLAYQGRPGRPAGMLVFDVELISVDHAPEPPSVPEDVAAAPPSATTTDSGLASRVLEAGTGSAHPAATDRVRVHYTGWTTDGEMFDSSVTRGRPATFPLNRVIAGWTEGVQLMVVGEKRRFWIPANLAYEGRPGPQGTLVFDVELLEIIQ